MSMCVRSERTFSLWLERVYAIEGVCVYDVYDVCLSCMPHVFAEEAFPYFSFTRRVDKTSSMWQEHTKLCGRASGVFKTHIYLGQLPTDLSNGLLKRSGALSAHRDRQAVKLFCT